MGLRTNTWLIQHNGQEVFCHGQIKHARSIELYCNDPNGDRTLVADQIPDENRESWNSCVRYLTDTYALTDLEELHAL